MPKNIKNYPRHKKDLTQEEILETELNNNKEVEYYSNLMNAWITTRMEKDKAILALSTGGIGVLITFFNNISIDNKISFFLYILALLCFIVSIYSAIKILSENADYCMAIMSEEEPENEGKIGTLDNLLVWSFLLGLAISIILSIILISEKSSKKIEEHSLNNIKKIEKKIQTLKTQYSNDLTKLEEMSNDLIDIKNYKIKLDKEVNNLSNKLKDLEDIDKLNQEKKQLEIKINETKKVID